MDQQEEIIKYDIQTKTKKKRNIKTNTDIDKKLEELNSKIAKIEQLEKEKQQRIEQKKLLRDEKLKQKEIEKQNKIKENEEKQKQKQIDIDNRIRKLIEESKKTIIKNKIDEIDTHKIDIQNFHIQRHNQIRRLNLNF